jgi:hypothetical protein
MSRTTDKMTYTDGQYFCDICDSPHEGESLAEACYDSHKRMRVLYTVQFECDVVLEEGDDYQDAISNIDIPEGGRNGSVYCENSFDIIEASPVEGA